MDGKTVDRIEHEAALTRFGGRMPTVPKRRPGRRMGLLAGVRYRYVQAGKLARTCFLEHRFETI